MSEKTLISKAKIGAMIELAIQRTKAEQAAEAPDYVVHSSTVYITNNYGDSYEPNNDPVASPSVAAQPASETRLAIRKGISTLLIRAENKARELEERSKDSVTPDARSAIAALDARFDDLKLRLKGDTSLALIQDAYTMMVLQLCLASDLSGVFEDVDG